MLRQCGLHMRNSRIYQGSGLKNGNMNRATSIPVLPAIAAIVAVLVLSACGGDINFGIGGGDDDGGGSGQATVSAVTLGNKLITFNQTAPGIVLSSNSISGLQGGDSIVGIDFRPANRKLYILTNNAGT